MMFKTKRFALAISVFTLVFISCKKDSTEESGTPNGGTNPTPTGADTTGKLKDAASFPVGVAIGYDIMKNNPTYAAIVKGEFDNVTFDYHMKHGAIVKNDGSLDFTRADELLNLVNAGGVGVYGHTLAWHQNNNTSYLRSLLSGSASQIGSNLILNGSFENASASSFTNWFTQVTGTAAASISQEATEVSEGSKAIKVVVATPSTQAYHVQIVNDAWVAQIGKQYKISFYAKGFGAKLRAVSQGTNYYEQNEITTTNTWTKYDWVVAPSETAPQVKFHFPEAGTFYLDNVTVYELSSTSPSAEEVKTRVDNALKNFVTGMVTHYKGKVSAWDVVNESMADGNSGLRTNPTPGTTTGDEFYWSEYLGRGYIAKAFQYANAADPAALLFINDYNLEFNTVKLDSLINLVNELKTQNVPIHGIGTQMHMNINTPKANIDNMFKKLAATGLKVKVTELDIRLNPTDQAGFSATPAVLTTQADMYQYVVESYIQNVPAAQRYGITVWGVGDPDSWILTVQKKNDLPLLYNNTYSKKPAFYGFLKGLKKS